MAVSTESARRDASGLGCSAPKASAVLVRVAHHQPVDDDLHGVALVLVQGGRGIEVELLAIHAHAHEPLPAGTLEHPVALGLAVTDDRPEDEQPAALGHRQDPVHDLGHGHPGDLVAVGAVRMADTGEQQPEVVVDLGHGAHGRARVAAGALLVDGDGRRQPVDLVDVGLLHLAQELAGVRREALDVPPLALGVDGVEGEAGLAAAGQPGDDGQPVAGHLDRDVLEVVFAGTANDEEFLWHPPSLPIRKD